MWYQSEEEKPAPAFWWLLFDDEKADPELKLCLSDEEKTALAFRYLLFEEEKVGPELKLCLFYEEIADSGLVELQNEQKKQIEQ